MVQPATITLVNSKWDCPGKPETANHQFMKHHPVLFTLTLLTLISTTHAQPYFGNGIKIGETTSDSTIVWLRLTERAEPKWDGLEWLGVEDRDFDVGQFGEKQLPESAALADMAGSLSGMAGSVRLSWWQENRPDTKSKTEWLAVDPERDFTRQVILEDLARNQRYKLEIECKSFSDKSGQSISGSFKTAPGPARSKPFHFVMSTCQSWKTRDKGTAGKQIYDQMLGLNPDFFVHLGDIVYYDKRSAGGDVDARSPELARFHWNRWYGCSDIVQFHKQVPSFFIKDDHDTVTNDSAPGMRAGKLTWNTGLSIFLEQVPIEEPTYRSRRWSKDLHFWAVEGRDYRSQNNMPDGPHKSIWGPKQKAWFKEEVLASDAPFKILFTPTPVVGPDRENKKDNYANSNWTFEGDEIREFCAENNVIVVCGDRHWQYHSIDDETGLHEFACGAGSDAHAGGFSKDLQTEEHQYLEIIGGFLSAEINPAKDCTELTFRHHRVDGSVSYEYTYSR
jgi:alkaline phosphatase D